MKSQETIASRCYWNVRESCVVWKVVTLL